jgi:hypothetical protein
MVGSQPAGIGVLVACQARGGLFHTWALAPQCGKKQECARRRIGVRGHPGVIPPATITVLAGEESVSCPLEGFPHSRRERELRGDYAGRPVGSFARKREEIVPEAIGTLTFEEEPNTTLEDVSKLSKVPYPSVTIPRASPSCPLALTIWMAVALTRGSVESSS